VVSLNPEPLTLNPPPSVLTIAGSDPSGGAGIQADLKTYAALGVYGMAAITALTAQNTTEVTGIHEIPADFVALQIDTVLADITPDAVKTGMLANAEIIRIVAAKAHQYSFRNLVVDPVMVAKSGDRLLRDDAVNALRSDLIPVARVLTPNLPEASDILGRPVRTVDDMRAAARDIHALGAASVVIKGGHLPGDTLTDILFDGTKFSEFNSERVPTKNTHGTGCTFASAIAAYLARGEALHEAVRKAKDYLTEAIRRAYDIGHGHGPVNHAWQARAIPGPPTPRPNR
jgi:hydroxymethylpyrimidine/phosphomethylpyrimidine kinase